jgi:hypothetical protein
MTADELLREFRLWCQKMEPNPRPATLRCFIQQNAPHLDNQWRELWAEFANLSE